MFALSVCLLGPASNTVLAQEKPKPADSAAAVAAATAAAPAKSTLTADQLDALVAPIALYSDDLLAQTLVASTYPLEIVQLQQWLAKHPKLKDKALADSVAKQPWDPAIQSMAAVPEVVKRLADDIQWSTDLGNAFLAQQSDVMNAVQRMRKKAKSKGALESNEQQKVETQVIKTDTVIIVQQKNPDVVYVPTYSPTVVYGPPVYPYPPIYYPYYPPGAAMVTFGIGMMWGAAMWGGSCCHAGWGGGNTVIINNNNNFNQINHNNRGQGQGNRGQGGNNWQHNAEHRGGAPYGDRGTANKYGGSARGQPSAGTRPAQGGASAGTRPSQGGASAGTRPSQGGASAGTRPAQGGASAGARPSQGGASASTRPSQGGGGGGMSSSSATSGGSRGYSGSGARSSSMRGSSSMGGMRGGGGGGGRRR